MDKLIGIILISLLTSVAIFQFALAAGLEQGDMVFGGYFPKKLPPRMKILSVITGFSLLIMGYFYAMITGIIESSINETNLRNIILFITIFIGLNTLGNIASKSKKERLIMTPITLIIFVCSIVLLTN